MGSRQALCPHCVAPVDVLFETDKTDLGNNMLRKVLDHLEWAEANHYTFTRENWPTLQGGVALDGSIAIGGLLSAIDNYYKEQGHIVIDARDVTIVHWKWPSGDERWEIIGRDGSVLSDQLFRIFYPPVVGKCPIQSFDWKSQTLELNLDAIPKLQDLSGEFVFGGGQDNYGHWVDHHLPMALLLRKFNLPYYFRKLNQDQIDLLEVSDINSFIEIPDTPLAFSQKIARLVLTSKPPPSLIGKTLREGNFVKPSAHPFLDIHLIRTRGNIRVANALEVQQNMSRRGFLTVPIDRLPVSDVLEIFSQARFVFCEGGASLANLLLMPSVNNLVVMDENWLSTQSLPHALGLAPILMGLESINLLPCVRSNSEHRDGMSEQYAVSLPLLNETLDLLQKQSL